MTMMMMMNRRSFGLGVAPVSYPEALMWWDSCLTDEGMRAEKGVCDEA